MPISKGRKEAEFKKKQKERERLADHRSERERTTAPPGSGLRWIAPAFITTFILGVAWLVVYYVAAHLIPPMMALGGWNVGIGMGLMAISFVLITFWK